MNIQQLKYFVKAAQMQNLTSASKALFISPQALSKQIISLEEELGTSLFERKRSRYELTPIGKQIYQETEILIDNFNDSVDRIYSIVRRENNSVTLVCPEGRLEAFSVNPVTEFEKETGASVEVLELPDVICEEYITSHRVNIGLSTQPLDVSRYRNTLIASSNLCAVVKTNHPLANKNILTFEDLIDHPVQAKNKLFRAYTTFTEIANRKGLNLNILRNSADYPGFINTISDLNAVGVGLNHLEAIKNFVKIPFNEEMQWNLYLVQDKTVDLPPLIKKFTDIIANLAETV